MSILVKGLACFFVANALEIWEGEPVERPSHRHSHVLVCVRVCVCGVVRVQQGQHLSFWPGLAAKELRSWDKKQAGRQLGR